MKRLLITTLGLALVAGCGGGGGTSSAPQVSGPAIPATQATNPPTPSTPAPANTQAPPGVISNPSPAPISTALVAIVPSPTPAPPATPTPKPTATAGTNPSPAATASTLPVPSPTPIKTPSTTPVHFASVSCPTTPLTGSASQMAFYTFITGPNGVVSLEPDSDFHVNPPDFGCTSELTVQGSGSNGILIVWVAAGIAFLENGQGPFGPFAGPLVNGQSIFCCSTLPHAFNVNRNQSLLFAVNEHRDVGGNNVFNSLAEPPATDCLSPTTGCISYIGIFDGTPLPQKASVSYAPGTIIDFATPTP